MQPHSASPRVVFDTNILVEIEKSKADVFSMARNMLGAGINIAVTKQVKHELEQMKGKGKEGRAAKVALMALEGENAGVIDTGRGNADDSMLEAAKQGWIAATNDRELRKRIKDVGGAVIYLKRNRLLELG